MELSERISSGIFDGWYVKINISSIKCLVSRPYYIFHTKKETMSTAIGLDSSHKFGGKDIRLLSNGFEL